MKKFMNILLMVIGIIFTIITIILLTSLFKLGAIPDNYFIILAIAVGIVTLIIDFFLLFRFKKRLFLVFKYISLLVVVVLILVFSYGIYSLNQTFKLFDKAFSLNEEVTDYYIVVLKDSVYEETSDLYGKSLSYYTNTDSSVIDSLKLDLSYEVESDIDVLKENLFNNKVDAILISDIILNRYEDDDEDFTDEVRIIETISISNGIQDITKKVSIKNTPFNVLISGIDTYGDINKTSRNDVNIIATINPNTNEILLTSIPRDYYVQLHGTTGYKDKLTHASYYGINTAVQTIEDILDIDINYYVKVNFTTVVDLVDEIGGIEIYSDTDFIPHTDKSVHVVEGWNTFNGKQALAYSRERYAYVDGDRHRGRNQQQVITAIFNKLTSGTTILTQYNDILEAVDGKFTTNMDLSEFSSFVKYELNDLSSYKIKSIQLDGDGSMEKTYSYPSQDLWVMIPDEDTIEAAKTTINKVLNNESVG
jgi:LCP family protein required for cell wall assembly